MHGTVVKKIIMMNLLLRRLYKRVGLSYEMQLLFHWRGSFILSGLCRVQWGPVHSVPVGLLSQESSCYVNKLKKKTPKNNTTLAKLLFCYLFRNKRSLVM